MTESKFRERRSAFSDESPEEPATPAPEPATPAPEPATEAPEAATDAPEPTGYTEPVTAAPEPPPDGDDAPFSEAAAELDRMAEMEIPPPSFLELVEPHVEMAFRFLGQLPLTPEGERRVLPGWAKREIDLLGLLEQRTRGNLPPEEERVMKEALDELRTLYLKVVG